MKKFFLCFLFFLSVFCFAQADNTRLFQVQTGAFREPANAERAFNQLRNAGLNPSLENHMGNTRVRLTGVNAQQLPALLNKVHSLGFTNPWVREEAPALLYKIQVGTFLNTANANTAFIRLHNAGLNPSFENHMGSTRVLVTGVELRHLPSMVHRVNEAGFNEIWIRE